MPGRQALVTGGTGFVGAHVARALLERGDDVRCLVRPGSDRENLAGLPVHMVEGDILDRASLSRAMVGVHVVFHCAADYRLWVPLPDEMYRVNVDGCKNVLEAAGAAGVERIVHTSTVGALGLDPSGRPADEETPVNEARTIGAYKRSKLMAERLVQRMARRGLPVVIVNPSTPIGPLDRKPTPTGKMIVDCLNRRAPAYVDTGLNVVDVRDVARGELLAADRGRPGERYILGGKNCSLREIFQLIAQIGGLPAPRLRLPHWLPWALSWTDTQLARLRSRPPAIPLDAVRMARHRMFFDSSKAERELGYEPGDVEPAFEEAVRWFCDNGYTGIQ